jgi:LysR family transcriptional activator of mexEF-oprN operon
MNLLVIFETLMFEKNLTRAGEKLSLGQPAVSAALARLRDLFDDPLLVTLEPTQRALAIPHWTNVGASLLAKWVSQNQYWL